MFVKMKLSNLCLIHLDCCCVVQQQLGIELSKYLNKMTFKIMIWPMSHVFNKFQHFKIKNLPYM